MSVFVHREIAYGFRRTVGFVAAEDLRGRQLARVEALLIDAGNAFRARRYRDAIDSYEAVQALVWAQLFPARGILSAEGLAASNLFEPLVSVAGDWLNVLPVETPKIGVHPRVDFDVDAPEQLGLLGSGLRGRGPAAVARLHTAALLRAAGDPRRTASATSRPSSRRSWSRRSRSTAASPETATGRSTSWPGPRGAGWSGTRSSRPGRRQSGRPRRSGSRPR